LRVRVTADLNILDDVRKPALIRKFSIDGAIGF
jgi:hypothetical protein